MVRHRHSLEVWDRDDTQHEWVLRESHSKSHATVDERQTCGVPGVASSLYVMVDEDRMCDV